MMRCGCCDTRPAEVPLTLHFADGDSKGWVCIDCAMELLTVPGAEVDMSATSRLAFDFTPEEG